MMTSKDISNPYIDNKLNNIHPAQSHFLPTLEDEQIFTSSLIKEYFDVRSMKNLEFLRPNPQKKFAALLGEFGDHDLVVPPLEVSIENFVTGLLSPKIDNLIIVGRVTESAYISYNLSKFSYNALAKFYNLFCCQEIIVFDKHNQRAFLFEQDDPFGFIIFGDGDHFLSESTIFDINQFFINNIDSRLKQYRYKMAYHFEIFKKMME